MAQNVEDVTFNVTANTGQAEQALAKLRGEVDRTSASLGRKGDAAKKASENTINATGAVVSFGRIIQDAPFGIIGVGNNITMLAEQFVALRLQAGSTAGALTAMKAALFGPMGLTIAISVATSALTLFSLASRGAKKAVNEVEGALKKVLQLKNPLEGYKTDLSVGQLRNMMNQEKAILKENESELAKLKRAGYGFSAVDFYASQSGAKTQTGDEQRAIAERIKKLETETEASKIFIQTIEGQVRAYEKLDAASRVLDRYFKRDNGSETPEETKLPELKLDKTKIEETKTFLETFKESVLTEIEIDNLLEKKTNRSAYSNFLKTINEQITNGNLGQKELLEWLKLRKQIMKEMEEDFTYSRTEGGFDRFFGLDSKTMKGVKKLSAASERETEQNKLKEAKEKLAEEKKQAKEQYKIYKEFFIDPFTETFRGEFSKAWNSIFGEANSLLEKFIQRVGEALFNKAVGSAATGLLDLVIPGAGAIIGTATGGGNKVVVNTFIDGEMIATSENLVRGITANQNRMQSLGLL